ncbi:MAG: hypothetical protein D6720_11815 [Gammaproteobacteria bacterium]|nr:MAG: hypothetical protein D6720_11815 [Gammaproteobacteria bacterium]
MALLTEPALANKFETISGGVTGSTRLKRAFVQHLLLYGGGGFLVAAVLAVVVPHTNPVFLNYANWKVSAIVLAVIGSLLLISYLFV